MSRVPYGVDHLPDAVAMAALAGAGATGAAFSRDTFTSPGRAA